MGRSGIAVTPAALALGLAAALLPSAAGETHVPAGCVELEVDDSSDALITAPVLQCTATTGVGTDLAEAHRKVRVILPEDYDGVTEFPVVYLLHGVGDTFATWVDNTDVEEFAPAYGAVIVMPDGGTNGGDVERRPPGWYSDWQDGSRDFEAFHTVDLPNWVQTSFRVHPEGAHTGIMGLSMGGFGAMKYAGRHPERYAAAASFSGLLDTQMAGPVEGVAFGLGPVRDFGGTPDDRVWGDPVTEHDNWAQHNPAALARDEEYGYDHLDGNLWLTTGTGTPGGPEGEDEDNPGAYAVEQFIWQTNQSFKANLTLAGTEFVDLSYLGGYHGWSYWQAALHEVLPLMTCEIGGGCAAADPAT